VFVLPSGTTISEVQFDASAAFDGFGEWTALGSVEALAL
jgi:hypothetical protein